MSELTEKQRAILEFLFAAVERDGHQPSLREFMAEFGIGSMNGVACHLKAMQKKGYIGPGNVQARALPLLRLPDGTPFLGFRAIRDAEP
jgi:repressor LexA